MDLVERGARAFSILADRYGVELALLFGSVARGRAGPLSDVDIAVKMRDVDKLPDLIVDLAELMEIPEERLDVVPITQELPSELRYRIFAEGVLLYAASRELYVEEAVRAFSEWGDFEIFLKKHDLPRRLWEKSPR